MLAEMLVPQVLGDLAQPDGHFARPVEPSDGADGLVKSLLGQLLRQVRVMSLGQEELVDGLGVLLVNGAHIVHQMSLLSPIYPPGRGFVTVGVKKFDGRSRQIFHTRIH